MNGDAASEDPDQAGGAGQPVRGDESVRADRADQVDEVTAVVRALGGVIVAGHRYRLAVAEHFAIGLVETHAISYISVYGPMSQTRLAQLMNLTGSAITGVVDRLERGGYARRAAYPNDRRRYRIELDTGSETLIHEIRAGLGRALEQLDPTLLRTLREALPQVAANTNTEADQLHARDAHTARKRPDPT